MLRIPIPASKNYDVIIGDNIFPICGKLISDALNRDSIPKDTDEQIIYKKIKRKICIITDGRVNNLYLSQDNQIIQSLKNEDFEVFDFIIPEGEDSKDFQIIIEILEFLIKHNFSRTDALLALGGGVIGDITGFTASIYMRGIQYIQFPTTLLAIADSSIGGKTAINLLGIKNQVGSFWHPSLVLFDSVVLSTLTPAMKQDGLAEIIKIGVISNEVIFASINLKISIDEPSFFLDLLSLCIEAKSKLVAIDELDKGNRMLLNFGHTIGHAIEKCSNYNISHGLAVAKGMYIVAKASDRLEFGVEKCSEKIFDILQKYDFPLDCPYSAWELADAALQDKKIKGDEITLVVPAKIGKCILKNIPISKLELFISYGLNG